MTIAKLDHRTVRTNDNEGAIQARRPGETVLEWIAAGIERASRLIEQNGTIQASTPEDAEAGRTGAYRGGFQIGARSTLIDAAYVHSRVGFDPEAGAELRGIMGALCRAMDVQSERKAGPRRSEDEVAHWLTKLREFDARMVSRPDGWICTAPEDPIAAARVVHLHAAMETVTANGFTCVPYWLSPPTVMAVAS